MKNSKSMHFQGVLVGLTGVFVAGTRGTPWTGLQSVAWLTQGDRQPFTFTFTPIGNLESPINLHPLTASLWAVGR